MNLLLAEKLAKYLMRQWEVGDEWEFVWSNGKRQLGCATETRNRQTKVVSKRQLRLSKHLVRHNEESEVRDVILHEIAHIKAGLDNGHNHIWKQWCVRVGARPERCADTNKLKVVEPKYIVVCTLCETTTRKADRRIRLQRRYCGKCGTKSVGKLEMRWNPERGQAK